ncbi:MAG: hypothetical protein U5N56_03160 [Candidatus Marinimicrobia bacterium]|nr:hypothetical protein [Candidatus Neomarinimicrobiota bacterium]
MIFLCRIATTREKNPISERKKMQRLSGARLFCILANAEDFAVRQLAEEKRRFFFCLLPWGSPWDFLWTSKEKEETFPCEKNHIPGILFI